MEKKDYDLIIAVYSACHCAKTLYEMKLNSTYTIETEGEKPKVYKRIQ